MVGLDWMGGQLSFGTVGSHTCRSTQGLDVSLCGERHKMCSPAARDACSPSLPPSPSSLLLSLFSPFASSQCGGGLSVMSPCVLVQLCPLSRHVWGMCGCGCFVGSASFLPLVVAGREGRGGERWRESEWRGWGCVLVYKDRFLYV